MIFRSFVYVFSLYIVPFFVLTFLVNDYLIAFFCDFLSFGMSLVLSYFVILGLCLYFFRSSRFDRLREMAETLLFNKEFVQK